MLKINKRLDIGRLYHTKYFHIDFLKNIRLLRTKWIHKHRNLQYIQIQSLLVIHIMANNIYLMIIDMHKDLFVHIIILRKNSLWNFFSHTNLRTEKNQHYKITAFFLAATSNDNFDFIFTWIGSFSCSPFEILEEFCLSHGNFGFQCSCT